MRISDSYRLHNGDTRNFKSLIDCCLFGQVYLAAFFGDPAAFLTALGLAVFFAAGFLAAADFGFFGAAAFLTLGAVAALGFFADAEPDEALFFAAAGLAVVALVFGFTCRDFVVALLAPAALADLGFELERALTDLAALAFLGLAAGAALLAAAAGAAELPPVATFLTVLVPADFDRARFLVPDAALELDVLFLTFLVPDDFLATVASPSLNEPLAPLPLVCLKCFALTPFFNANFKC